MSERTCVIAGGSRGIGLATALRLANQDYNVVIAARTQTGLDDAIQKVAATGAACMAVTADIGQPEEAAQVIEAAVERFGRVDVLVNCAGVAPLAPIEELKTDDFEQLLDVNIRSVFYTTRAAWPIMRTQRGGVIVNISSMASVDPFPGFAAYGASKAWVNLFSQAIAAEGRPHGIRVFSVAPGAVETSLLRATFPDAPADKALDPDQVAAVVASVCAEHMTPCSGQTIFVRK